MITVAITKGIADSPRAAKVIERQLRNRGCSIASRSAETGWPNEVEIDGEHRWVRVEVVDLLDKSGDYTPTNLNL